MLVMPSNQSSGYVHYLAGRFPGQVGHFYSPGGQRGPYRWLPYALDNGAWVAHKAGKPWNSADFLALCAWATRPHIQQPRFVVCPDVVMDPKETIERWHEWAGRLRKFGWPVAFAVQDGMEDELLPHDADVLFVGGSSEFKRRTVWRWCQKHPRVHVGRVNSPAMLRHCHECGAESVDGTGWFRGDRKQLAGLERFLLDVSLGKKHPQLWEERPCASS